MRGRKTSRETDERLLRMLRCRTKGWSTTQIMRRFEPDMSPSNVDTLLNRVLAADLKESGEPERVVRAAYWTTRNRK